MTTTKNGVEHDRLTAYRATRQSATDWLLDQVNADGSIGDATSGGYFFYRAPWTFSLVGESDAASGICGWIRKHMLISEGTIGGPYRTIYDAWAYRDSALILGAHLAGQYDLSYGLMPEFLRLQDPISGGFPNDRLEDGSMGDGMSIPYTTGAGFACLATGHLEQARAVYRFLQTIYDAQDDLPRRFFYDWSRARQEPTRTFSEEDQFWYVVENSIDRNQRWTLGGIAAGFLCRLYLAEPRPEYLDLARLYQAFSMAATEHQFKYDPVCKSGWGSSLLYLVTGETQYRDWTYRMGDWFVSQQHPEGYWVPQASGDDRNKIIHNALEFVMHVDTIIAGLSAHSTDSE